MPAGRLRWRSGLRRRRSPGWPCGSGWGEPAGRPGQRRCPDPCGTQWGSLRPRSARTTAPKIPDGPLPVWPKAMMTMLDWGAKRGAINGRIGPHGALLGVRYMRLNCCPATCCDANRQSQPRSHRGSLTHFLEATTCDFGGLNPPSFPRPCGRTRVAARLRRMAGGGRRALLPLRRRMRQGVPGRTSPSASPSLVYREQRRARPPPEATHPMLFSFIRTTEGEQVLGAELGANSPSLLATPGHIPHPLGQLIGPLSDTRQRAAMLRRAF
jgi:hypothetical protein